MIKDYYWLITTISFVIGIFLFTVLAHAGGKIYQPKDSKYGSAKQYTKQQQINSGTTAIKKYTTCRLKKRIKSRHTGRQACIYEGGNKTFELMYENTCPKKFKCVYNPNQKEPNIDDVIDSLNNIKK